MKKRFKLGIIFITGFVFALSSCKWKQANLTNEQIIRNYYNGYNSGDFNLISKCISDSIVFADHDYVLAHNLTELYLNFQWDSVFKPKYELYDFKNDSNSTILIVKKICKRIEFLQDSACVFKIRFDFNNDQIVKIQVTDYIYFDSEKWNPRRDSLIAWIDINHPELSGFFSEESFKGAEKFSKAIDLYRAEK